MARVKRKGGPIIKKNGNVKNDDAIKKRKKLKRYFLDFLDILGQGLKNDVNIFQNHE